jgi:YVTN family beta-propeller protein
VRRAFTFAILLLLSAQVLVAVTVPEYLSPGELAISSDGSKLFIVCERSDELRIADARTGKLIRSIPVGHVPRGLTLSPDGRVAYVTNSWDDSVSVIDLHTYAVVRSIKTGFEPISVAIDGPAKTLFTANRIGNDISVIDLATGTETKRLLAGRGNSYFATSPDGRLIYATHVYPNPAEHRKVPQSEISVLDVDRQVVSDRKLLPNVAGTFHIAISKDGRLGVAAQLHPKNLVPLAHVEHGWVFGNSLTLFGDDIGGTLDVPIDELDRYFALPYGVAIKPDKSKLYVSSAGADTITVIDVQRLLRFARQRKGSFANDLSASSNYVISRINVGRNPRGIVLSPDGRLLFVANRMDDSISVISTVKDKIISTIDLGGRKELTALRLGERIFNSASFGFQKHFGCANCHIDGTFDGMQWDLEPDGFGKDIVDNRLLEDLMGTEPFKWNGGNPDMPTECGPRTEKYFYRSQSYDPKELANLVTFVMSQPFSPNRYRLATSHPTAAQEHGKEIFERTVDKTGKPIAEGNRCNFCHSGPKYANQKSFDVGTGKPTDRSPLVDTPQVNNVYMTAPYLHDGSARSLEEIWTIFNPNDKHGRTNDLTKDELNDLIEYLRTL